MDSGNRSTARGEKASGAIGSGFLRDANAHTLAAGITTAVFFFVTPGPILIAVANQLSLDPPQTESWLFVGFLTSGIAGLGLSLVYRMPLPVGWTIPGIIYLGTLAGQFSFSEIVGANLLTGLLVVAIGIFGWGSFLLRCLPASIILGMFSGSILGYITRLVTETVGDLTIGGVTVLGYLVGLAIASPRVPPLALALFAGAVASMASGWEVSQPVVWALPALVIPEASLSIQAVVAIALPMVILSAGLGTVQGLGYLQAQNYEVPTTAVTVTVGVCSVFNALFCGHPAITARSAVAILASPEAGPANRRYVGAIVASAGLVIFAFCAAPLTSLLNALPRSYIVVLAGLAILAPFQDAIEKAFSGKLRLGTVVAFGVAATSFSVLGMPSAAWAIAAGIAVSLVAERRELVAHWRE